VEPWVQNPSTAKKEKKHQSSKELALVEVVTCLRKLNIMKNSCVKLNFWSSLGTSHSREPLAGLGGLLDT
jgi:hypothetical protein